MCPFWLFPRTDFKNGFYQLIGNALFSQYINSKLKLLLLLLAIFGIPRKSLLIEALYGDLGKASI